MPPLRMSCADASVLDIAMDIVAHEPWTAGMALVAERFADRRVLLAGDAVHLFTPTGGFRHEHGHRRCRESVVEARRHAARLGRRRPARGPTKVERMPIALRNTEAARQLTANIGETDVDPAIEHEIRRPERRHDVRQAKCWRHFREQFASIGVQLGSRYDGSTIIASNVAPPADSLITYTPTSIPGGRAPHFWLDEGRTYGSSLYDQLGTGFTLLRLGPAPNASELMTAAADLNIPIKVIDVADTEARDLYDCGLALIRPDQHVAWRGNTAPADAKSLMARLVGVYR